MTEAQNLIRLMTWASPAFPIGSFAYSHGLEAAFANGLMARDDMGSWLAALLTQGSLWCDGVLLAESWRQAEDAVELRQLTALGKALSGSPSRELETMAQGAAFVIAASAWPGLAEDLPSESPLPVAFGAVAARSGVPLEAAISAYFSTFLSNLIQASIRLGHLGQQEGVRLLAGLEPLIVETAGRAAASSLDDLGTATIMAEIAALSHETLGTRIFRS